ncbi:YihY/virulence factor BrkB family protein [Bellilinea sp.]|jgi:membrane protein|uniref:YihY/virulence factor BrkB family protein n=1 Tax=Bellilinea sp. TaxID=2838785 RepID=UPI002ADD32E5|nr:YihY/virulence factor BrkB family protein [Bellilinea sp.]
MVDLKQAILPYYLRLNRFSRGTIEIIRVTLKNFTLARGSEAAASLAYYALFSLFPLLLILISVAGFILKREDAYQAVLTLVFQALPNAEPLIERNLQVILSRRGTIGVIGLLGAFWSASGFFNTLVRNINHAWLNLKPRDVIRTRLLALGMIGMIILLLVLSLLSTAVFNLIRIFDQVFLNGDHLENTVIYPYLRVLIPAFFTFLMFLIIYRWIPNTKVRWRACMWGSLWTSVAWELAKFGFSAYLSSGLAQYEILYGSLGTVLALMFYIYLSCTIILLGAHLTATIDQRKPRRTLHPSTESQQTETAA